MEPRDHDRIAEHWLDTALKQYGEAEPRAGLEGRILANLRAANEQPAARRNWWPVVAAVAAIVLGGATIFVIRGRFAAKQEIARVHTAPAVEIPASQNAGHPPTRMAAAVRQRARRFVQSSQPSRVVEAATGPRLEQFPSPRPLSEQEKVLANYVAQFHKEAVLVARVQAEIIKQDLLEFEKQHEPPEEPQDTSR